MNFIFDILTVLLISMIASIKGTPFFVSRPRNNIKVSFASLLCQNCTYYVNRALAWRNLWHSAPIEILIQDWSEHRARRFSNEVAPPKGKLIWKILTLNWSSHPITHSSTNVNTPRTQYSPQKVRNTAWKRDGVCLLGDFPCFCVSLCHCLKLMTLCL